MDNREQFTLVAASGLIDCGAWIGMLPSNSVTGSADYFYLELHNAYTCYLTKHELFNVLFIGNNRHQLYSVHRDSELDRYDNDNTTIRRRS
jgi:hypothetical protein